VFVITARGNFVFRFNEWKPMSWGSDRTIGKGFVDRLNKIPGFDQAEPDLDKKHVLPLTLLLDRANLDLFKKAVSWLKQEVLTVERQS
jgi:hypothetical protein